MLRAVDRGDVVRRRGGGLPAGLDPGRPPRPVHVRRRPPGERVRHRSGRGPDVPGLRHPGPVARHAVHAASEPGPGPGLLDGDAGSSSIDVRPALRPSPCRRPRACACPPAIASRSTSSRLALRTASSRAPRSSAGAGRCRSGPGSRSGCSAGSRACGTGPSRRRPPRCPATTRASISSSTLGVYISQQCGQSLRARRCASTAETADAVRNGSTPISFSRVSVLGRVVRVQRREHEVARERGLDRDLRGLAVADLADHHHVRDPSAGSTAARSRTSARRAC